MKRFIVVLLSALLLSSICGCSHRAASEPSGNVSDVSSVADEPKFYSALTGCEIDEETAYTRPVAIMINNLNAATPQSGVAKADIYFEIPAEGGITRIMAVFSDYEDIEEIGTVRSAREYYVDYALPLDAVFIHYGGSPSFYTLRKSLSFDECDGINGTVDGALFWRDSDRIKTAGYEHSVMTSGSKLADGLKTLGIRTDVQEQYTPFFNFSPTFQNVGQTSADKVTMKFSTYITAEFEYDPESKTYLRSQFGQKHIDCLDGSRLSVTNIVCLKTSVSAVSGDDKGRISVGTAGSGDGWYITGGFAQPVKWSKADISSPLVLLDENGNPLYINRGKTWFMINNSNVVME